MNLTAYLKKNPPVIMPIMPATSAPAAPAARLARRSAPVGTIPEGQRNSALSRFAGRVLKKYGADDGQAAQAFRDEAAKCAPPLNEKELSTIWNSALKFLQNTIIKAPDYVPPIEFNAPTLLLRPEHQTDVDEAAVLADHCGDSLRHSRATEFLVYDGKVWLESEARAHGLMHELTARQIAEHEPIYYAAKTAYEKAQHAFHEAKVASGAKEEGSKAVQVQADGEVKAAKAAFDREQAYRDFLLKCRNSGKIKGVLEESKTFVEIIVDELDKDPFLLNTPGGEVDLRTGEIMPHDPLHYHTRITAVAPSAAGKDVWLAFLNVITCGDRELERYFQLKSGETAIGRTFNEGMDIAQGKRDMSLQITVPISPASTSAISRLKPGRSKFAPVNPSST